MKNRSDTSSPPIDRGLRSILISPTAYKGTLSPVRAAGIMSRAVRDARPGCVVEMLPLADGGDGTLDILLAALGGRVQAATVKGPLGRPVRARWGIVPWRGRTAVIEMAKASGLALVDGKNKILEATTYGTGELIRSALAKGCRNILIGVGGTATGEGGAGALQALGLRYYDQAGRELSARPVDLIRLHRIDWSGLDRRLRRTRIYVLCDVTNPLLGPRGSARVFGPQKGANPAQVRFLEDCLRHWATFARAQTKNQPGAGAAGALAFGLSAFAGARLVPGATFVMEAVGWRRRARRADLILTGEGRLDRTSFSGKVVGAITAEKGRSRVVAICGEVRLSPKELKRRGVDEAVAMGPAAKRRPEQCLRRAVQPLFAPGSRAV